MEDPCARDHWLFWFEQPTPRLFKHRSDYGNVPVYEALVNCEDARPASLPPCKEDFMK